MIPCFCASLSRSILDIMLYHRQRIYSVWQSLLGIDDIDIGSLANSAPYKAPYCLEAETLKIIEPDWSTRSVSDW